MSGAQLQRSSAAANGANRRTIMAKEINFRKEIFLYRSLRIFAIIVSIFMGIFFHKFSLTFWDTYIFLLVVIVLSISFSPGQRLLYLWRSLLNMKFKTIPRTASDRAIAVPWVTDCLSVFAQDATAAIQLREQAIAQLDAFRDKLALGRQDPNILPQLRKELEKYDRIVKRSVADAKNKHAKYLKVWDFFTKDQPKGLGILRDLKDPEAFRKQGVQASK